MEYFPRVACAAVPLPPWVRAQGERRTAVVTLGGPCQEKSALNRKAVSGRNTREQALYRLRFPSLCPHYVMSGTDEPLKSWGRFHWLQLKHSRCFVEWVSDWMDGKPCSRFLASLGYLDAQVIYVHRTEWNRFLENTVEWADERTHVTHVNACLSRKQARNPKKTVPWWGFILPLSALWHTLPAVPLG